MIEARVTVEGQTLDELIDEARRRAARLLAGSDHVLDSLNDPALSGLVFVSDSTGWRATAVLRIDTD